MKSEPGFFGTAADYAEQYAEYRYDGRSMTREEAERRYPGAVWRDVTPYGAMGSVYVLVYFEAEVS